MALDGAMGTMIQQHKLEEEDYRGERFKDWHVLKGQQRPVKPDQPRSSNKFMAIIRRR